MQEPDIVEFRVLRVRNSERPLETSPLKLPGKVEPCRFGNSPGMLRSISTPDDIRKVGFRSGEGLRRAMSSL